MKELGKEIMYHTGLNNSPRSKVTDIPQVHSQASL